MKELFGHIAGALSEIVHGVAIPPASKAVIQAAIDAACEFEGVELPTPESIISHMLNDTLFRQAIDSIVTDAVNAAVGDIDAKVLAAVDKALPLIDPISDEENLAGA